MRQPNFYASHRPIQRHLVHNQVANGFLNCKPIFQNKLSVGLRLLVVTEQRQHLLQSRNHTSHTHPTMGNYEALKPPRKAN